MHLVARRAAEFGVDVSGEVRFRLEVAVERKNRIVSGIHRSIHSNLRRQSDHIAFIEAEARFVGDHEVEVDGKRLSFAKAVIATGSRRQAPPIRGLEQIDYLTNDSALHLERLPESLVVIGGGYVGLEFAQMYARFGTRVTLIGRNRQLAPGSDPELADLLADSLREEGVDVRLGATVSEVAEADGETTVTIEGEASPLRTEHLLVAAGRVGNTPSLDLTAAGIETTGRGFVQVDDQLATSNPAIWAIGDVKGGLMFTHVAGYDGPIAALNAVKGLGKTVDYRVVPRVVFTDPAFAVVGLTEDEAREKGYEVSVGSVPAVGGRSKTIGDVRGRLKVVVESSTGEILGFHILAHHGDDLLHEAVTAMHDRGGIERISKSIHAHPTLSEMVKSAAKAAG